MPLWRALLGVLHCSWVGWWKAGHIGHKAPKTNVLSTALPLLGMVGICKWLQCSCKNFDITPLFCCWTVKLRIPKYPQDVSTEESHGGNYTLLPTCLPKKKCHPSHHISSYLAYLGSVVSCASSHLGTMREVEESPLLAPRLNKSPASASSWVERAMVSTAASSCEAVPMTLEPGNGWEWIHPQSHSDY